MVIHVQYSGRDFADTPVNRIIFDDDARHRGCEFRTVFSTQC